MKILHPGDLVHARRHRWRVVDVRAYDECQLVTVSGVGAPNLGEQRHLLMPFDTIEPIERLARFRRVRPARWRRACRWLIAAGAPPGGLRAITRAQIDFLPHQLEPALAVVRGRGSRVLLADEVGLGKTIQAGILIAELRARGAADRILILTPAGLREQWAQELSGRFAIVADVVDFRSVRHRLRMLPVGVNPWSTWPVAIASIDYVKRPEIVRSVLACSWDVLVADEAHGVAGDSDRHDAVAALAARAAYVVLLTATPHSGDSRAFQSLCAIGAHDGPPLIFRRTRQAIRAAAPRRIHRIRVRPNAAERRMHALVGGFAGAVREERGDLSRDVWLALAVLHKRSLSSAYSLHQSVARRLSTLIPDATDVDDVRQLGLPLDAHGELDAADEAPDCFGMLTLRDRKRERRLLESLAAAASAAAAQETKLSALVRLVDRVGEPVVIFTEYRDTLVHVAKILARPAAMLHGGLSRQERVRALDAFASGDQTVLLATDAAGEGLNLHHTCRTVINLELPWNPMRLEQRIGRVDRIGQRRAVHAFHLIAADTGEERLLARLEERVARAQGEIGSPNPLGSTSPLVPVNPMNPMNNDEHATAKLVIGNIVSPPQAAEAPVALAAEPEAVSEAARLAAARVLEKGEREPAQAELETSGPWVTVARNSSTRANLGARIIAVWQLAIEDGYGRRVESASVATAIALSRFPALLRDVRWLEQLIQSATPHLAKHIQAHAASWLMRAALTAKAFVATRLARERAIAAAAPDRSTLSQPGLFDRRVHHALAAALAARQEAEEISMNRIAALERGLEVSTPAPKLLLVLLP